MKKIFAVIFPLLCLIGTASAPYFSDTEPNNLLSATDVEMVRYILTRECSNSDVYSVNLHSTEEGTPCLTINCSDNSSKCFSLDNGKSCKMQDKYDVFITEKDLSDKSKAADYLCGTYNGYYILRSNAERELGKLDGFFYSNFDPSNDCYEAIANCDGELYLAEDDCIRHISGVLFDFSEEIEEENYND